MTYSEDAQAVRAVFDVAADYITLETGHPADDAYVADFFADRPPTVTEGACFHLGAEQDGTLVGVAAYLFGYPSALDCYIGMMVFDPAVRGQGLGRTLVSHIVAKATQRGARRMLIAVLDENRKGRAFWESNGFTYEQTFAPTSDRHTRHRLIRQL
ncbi:GNAT family N-acetyltransferase [Pseudooctadecabacter jejudonensis]|uniref:GNAT family N-acetyltransferase n=1 Tax=Pseudooctadecabacter jejudonensis TaxID=1391910 RepID=UPI001356407E|nr:GNAT family N-acetyltransferase [Pseudooctadecabacter jejudonensis]